MAKKQHILIVDDDADLINILMVKLSFSGFGVLPALNAEEAMKTLRSVPVDLILLDIMMPKISGFDFLRGVAKEPSLKTIPVILLTAAGSEEQIREGLNLGAKAYVLKPFTFQDLLEKIADHLPKA